MILRVQNFMLVALFALLSLFWAQSVVQQNPASGGYLFFEAPDFESFADKSLNALEKIFASPKTAPECCNATNGGLPTPRKADNLVGGPLENATQVSGRFSIESGPPNGTVYRADNQGNITSYATYDSNGQILTRVDVTGAEHAGIPTPHVTVYGRNELPDGSVRVNSSQAEVRPATAAEIP